MHIQAFLFLFSLVFTFSTSAGAEPGEKVSGTWTYRSFHNNPVPVGGDPEKLQQLLFGEGTMQISVDRDNAISGVLSFGGAYSMDVTGRFTPGAAGVTDSISHISLTAKGRPDSPTSGWIYEYQAHPAMEWKHAVNQVPALLGSVIRSVPHNGRPAGVTASFIMVKR